MTTDPDAVVSDEVESLVRKRTTELVRSNEALRADTRRLMREVADLSRHLVELTKGSESDRETRRAALNLMEDAIAARKAELLENAERRRVEGELRQADRRKDEFLAT